MSDVAIRVENLGKQYHIGRQQARYKTIRETIVDGAKAPFRRAGRVVRGRGSAADLDETIWALKDVSFEVKQGEVVGVIGRNGAGKTTLLKILSRITEPTAGDAWIHGRVGSLLEVGTGFHPELTGRENVYLNGAILGMRRNEIDRKFDEIVDFSGIEKFIDTPVKHYSSGMYVRLAFSVAAHMETEILLVDEVLAVGDAQFQKKCLWKMGDVARGGRTVLFVSHSMRSILDLCGTVYLFESGDLVRYGQAQIIIQEYLSYGISSKGYWKRPKSIPQGKELVIHKVSVSQSGKEPANIVTSKSYFEVKFEYTVKFRLDNCSMVLLLTNASGVVVFSSWDTDNSEVRFLDREPANYQSLCRIPAHLLKPGAYFVTIAAHIHNVKVLDLHEDAFRFEVSQVGSFISQDRKGIISPLLKWVTIRI